MTSLSPREVRSAHRQPSPTPSKRPMDQRPPTPNPSPSASPKSLREDSPPLPKRQKRSNSSGAPRERGTETENAGSPTPLTPPHSEEPTSPRPPTPPISPCFVQRKATFTSLPADLQTRIVRLAIPTPPRIEHQQFVALDPRLLNPLLLEHWRRRNVIRAKAQVCRHWRKSLEPMLREPLLVTSMRELNAVAGTSYPLDKGKTVDRASPAIDEWFAEWRPPKPAPRRMRCVDPAAAQSRVRVSSLILWMTPLPNSRDRDRWPRWYLEDHLRVDLERLGVQELFVLAPSGATLASVLLATIPNRERITRLHLEVHHPTGHLQPPDPRFFNAYTKCPSSDHLCSRLLLHSDFLHSLTLRNVTACASLYLPHFSRLENFTNLFVNSLPGLCGVHPHPYHDVHTYRISLLMASQTSLIRGRIMVVGSFDYMDELGRWVNTKYIVCHKDPQGPVFWCHDDLWQHIATGVRSPRDIDDEEEDEEEEEDEDVDVDVDSDDYLDTEEEEETEREKATWRGKLRRLLPAQQPQQQQQKQRPLRIAG